MTNFFVDIKRGNIDEWENIGDTDDISARSAIENAKNIVKIWEERNGSTVYDYRVCSANSSRKGLAVK